MLDLFQIRPDYDLDVMQPVQSPTEVTVAVLDRLRHVLDEESPSWVLVQGDTTTTMAGGLGAFHHGCRVAHVEAGLRTFDKQNPWPEEMNRRVAGVVADVHFAPTETSAANLYREGIPRDRVYVTGNTVVDSLRAVAGLPFDPARTPLHGLSLDGKRVVVATMHRRETPPQAVEEVCAALVDVARRNDDVEIVFPVHPSPAIQGPVHRLLSDVDNISLLPPLEYQPMVWLLRRCHFAVTDSGGLQEEMASLGKPVLVVRQTTERPEGVFAGTARLVGTGREELVDWATRLLTESDLYEAMSEPVGDYGDGAAAQRIVDILYEHSQPSRATHH
jgi:UDP-N-acetylglucosamine 2-epimerase (non-hydrolysing)